MFTLFSHVSMILEHIKPGVSALDTRALLNPHVMMWATGWRHALEQHAARKGPCLYNSVDYTYSIPGHPHFSSIRSSINSAVPGKYCLLVLSTSEKSRLIFCAPILCWRSAKVV